jgi:hypothetical protein
VSHWQLTGSEFSGRPLDLMLLQGLQSDGRTSSGRVRPQPID